ncbi:MAG: response regulator [Burkholderiaceae bacterium]
MANILVVDDEMGIRELLSEILYDEGHVVTLAENAEQARQVRQRMRPDLVLLDIWMPDTDGVTLLKEWALNGQLTMPVVMMSGHASIDTAVEATRIGALDFLEKPITLQRLLHTVAQGLSRSSAPDIKEVVTQMSAPSIKAKAEHGVQSAEHLNNSTDTSEISLTQTHTLGESAPGLVQTTLLSPTEQLLANIDLTLDLREARDRFERIYFEFHLERENANITRVAERTGLERTHLYRKLKQLGIPIVKASKR